jgi:hypothetical protein
MRAVKISGDIDYKKKLLMSLFWTNRKAARTEGCAPFLIQKIKTKHTIYEANESQCLKLSDDVLEHVIMNIKDFKLVEFQINLGEEDIKITIHKDVFTVSTAKTRELEDEIINKIELEAKKRYPNICQKFSKRIGIHN